MMLCYDMVWGEYMIGNLANLDRGNVVSTVNKTGKTQGKGRDCLGIGRVLRWSVGERDGIVSNMMVNYKIVL